MDKLLYIYINGVDCLFSAARISSAALSAEQRRSYPYKYSLMHDEEDWETPVVLVNFLVERNFYGTVFSSVRFSGAENGLSINFTKNKENILCEIM